MPTKEWAMDYAERLFFYLGGMAAGFVIAWSVFR